MYCPECGNEIKDSLKGCEKCGKKVEHPKKWTYGSLVLLGIVLFIFLLIWYISFTNSGTSNILPKPQIHVDEISREYAFGQSLIMFHIYNSGNTAANNVFTQIDMIDGNSGKTIASKRIFVGNLNIGDQKEMSTTITHANSGNLKIRIVPQY